MTRWFPRLSGRAQAPAPRRRATAGLAVIFLAQAAPASAHATASATDAAVALPLTSAAVAYMAGLLRLWHRAGPGRGVSAARAGLFAAGIAAVAALLLRPLDGWAERGLSAHMVQHLGLMLVAAPLLVIGRPGLVCLWAFGPCTRLALSRVGTGPLGRVWRALTHPAGAWLVYFVALWVWHAPSLHQAALGHEAIHAAQHASFLLAAILFWTSIIAPSRLERRAGALIAVFATALQSCTLAALLTTAGTVWYPAYGPAPFGLSPLADQQLGGLLMWAPCCALLIGAALATLARLLRETETRAQRTAP